jgi:hypothetical protein
MKCYVKIFHALIGPGVDSSVFVGKKWSSP